jgi:hypothetical protein
MGASCGSGAFDKDADFIAEPNPPDGVRNKCVEVLRQATTPNLNGTSITP